MSPQLGRLEQIKVRTAWSSEAADFTPWLAQEDNLALLGQTIGIDLELEAQERSVGPFRADILCKDVSTNHWVLIENQLEPTDHGHLGQLLTYAAGLDAVTIIWVSAGFREEHRAALDWLNEKTDDSVLFFGLEIELWRINDSPPAPKFNIVCKPNDWTASVAQTARSIESGVLTPMKELQLAYWQQFTASVQGNRVLRPQSARPQSYLYLSSGRGGVEYIARFSSRDPWVQVSVNLNTQRSDSAWFPLLLQQREEIDRELGTTLDWDHPRDNYKENRMAIRLEGADFREQSDWPRQHDWLRRHLTLLYQVFGPRIRALPQLGQVSAGDDDDLSNR